MRELRSPITNEVGNNPKPLWSVLKKACSPSKKQHAVPTLKQDGVLVTEANIVADVLNKNFTSDTKNIPMKLKKKLKANH